MKMTFISKAGLLLAQALILYGSLQADAVKETTNDMQQEYSNLFSPIDSNWERQRCREKESLEKKENLNHQEINASLAHLYAFNNSGSSGTTVPFGEDVPFNNGSSISPPAPLVKGKAITQPDNTHFHINEDGDYMVTFFGYTTGVGTVFTGVQLFVNSVAVGPPALLAQLGDLISFSQIIRISGASKTSPSIVEVKAVAAGGGPFPDLVLQNFNGIDATIEIIKLSNNHH